MSDFYTMSDFFDTPEEDIDACVRVNYENDSSILDDAKSVETFIKSIEAAERAGVLETWNPQGLRNDWKEVAGVSYDEEEQIYELLMDGEVSVVTEDYEELENFVRDTELYISQSNK